MRKIRTNLVSPLSPDEVSVLRDHVLEWDGKTITALRPFDHSLDVGCEDRTDCVMLPGLIDIHVHLSQYRIRGQYEPALLPWLEKHVFPAEALSRDPEYAQSIAKEFFQALFAAGTTTSVIYTAPFPTACEAAFITARDLGARAFIGMTLMDQNSPPDLLQSTAAAYEQSVELFTKYDKSDPLLRYIFTPRFAVSCSAELMRKIAAFASANSAWIQTHLSENQDEISFVQQAFGADSYTQVYELMGLLRPQTILAHAIHLDEKEMDTLARHHCKIAHCPDSNFYLKSGEFKYQSLADHDLEIGIGSDVAAGTSLSMLYHAKLANFRQSALPLLPARLLYHITLGNAQLLDLDDRIGSLETGKEADLCLLRLPSSVLPDENLPSALCFWGHEFTVVETVIAGRSVYSCNGA